MKVLSWINVNFLSFVLIDNNIYIAKYNIGGACDECARDRIINSEGSICPLCKEYFKFDSIQVPGVARGIFKHLGKNWVLKKSKKIRKKILKNFHPMVPQVSFEKFSYSYFYTYIILLLLCRERSQLLYFILFMNNALSPGTGKTFRIHPSILT